MEVESTVLTEEDHLKSVIGQLQTEIDHLENRLEERKDVDVIATKKECIVQVLAPYAATHDQQNLKLLYNMNHLDNLVKINSLLTNLDFKSVQSRLIDTELSQKRKCIAATGECCGLPFVINFKGELNNEGAILMVEDLNVEFDEDVLGNLAYVISCIEEKNDIQAFFTFIESFQNETERRWRVLAEHQKEYDGVVAIAMSGNDPHLKITNQNYPREKWRVFWNFKITSLYRVIPHIYLDIEHEQNSVDTKAITENLSGLFETILKKSGIKAALTTLVELVVD